MNMYLQIATFPVTEVAFDGATRLEGSRLVIRRQELQRLLLEDTRIQSAEIEIARPGERTRILHVLDTLEPRCKAEGPSATFPGFTGPPHMAGEGRTHALSGVTVMVSSRFPEPVTGLLQPREAIVDMAGPGAAYSAFSDHLNVVLVLEAEPSLPNLEWDAAIRAAGIKAAECLGRTAKDLPAPALQEFHLGAADPALPGVVYIDQVQSQGLFAQTFLYGKNLNDVTPTLTHPNEMLDGAVVSGNYVYGCVKNPTYMHCNNPVVRELYGRHGAELRFLGVIVSKGHNYTHFLKDRSANYAAKLARILGATGAVVTQEGGGNAAIDAMLTLKYCEGHGIKTTFLTFELGGADGGDVPIVDFVPEADALVSTGGQDRMLDLPAMDRCLGVGEVTGYGAKGTDAFTICLEQVYCSTNQLGYGRMAAVAY